MSARFDPSAWIGTAREFFDAGATRSLDFRRVQLHKLSDMIAGREQVWIDALAADLGKPPTEARLSEIGWVLNDIRHALRHLAQWSRSRRRGLPLGLWPGSSLTVPEPKGVVLVLAPWNYPLQLALSPLVSALAAGNVVCVKPSELAPNVSRAISEAVSATFPPHILMACEGDAVMAEQLLSNRFDHVFFTGSAAVGQKVMAAGARTLTPVTLELGGKSPCIVCSDTDPRIAARRIAWGKFMNAGQTCVAPDYVLVERPVRDALIKGLTVAVDEFYGSDPQSSPDYGRIVNAFHLKRLEGLLGDSILVCGGKADLATRYLAPTILLDPPLESAVMQEEIFGPILPVVTVDNIAAALEIVRRRPTPLALYLFSESRQTHRTVIRATRSGGVCVNDTIVQLFNRDLPFGGLGQSGLGTSHGEAGFLEFSHLRAVVRRRLRPDFAGRYPPVKLSSGSFDRVNRWLFG